MSGTVAGGIRTRDTNYKYQGRNYYRRIGAIDGKNGHTGGFYGDRERARTLGALGGKVSRRGHYKTTEKERREIRKAYEELLAIHNKAKRERADEGAITVFDRKRGLVVSNQAA